MTDKVTGSDPFQFLIGRLGTVRQDRLEELRRLFQFLIGRLGTKALANFNTEKARFQFLIGRLGTTRSKPPGRRRWRFNSS